MGGNFFIIIKIILFVFYHTTTGTHSFLHISIPSSTREAGHIQMTWPYLNLDLMVEKQVETLFLLLTALTPLQESHAQSLDGESQVQYQLNFQFCEGTCTCPRPPPILDIDHARPILYNLLYCLLKHVVLISMAIKYI